MKILFLDQSGKLGGAELCLVDIAKLYGKNALVGLFADGDFRKLLEKNHLPVKVLKNPGINVNKYSNLFTALANLGTVVNLIQQVVNLAQDYDIIYANTQKALVVGAIASLLTRKPLVYHLHDILSLDHFSKTNLQVAITLINKFASLVIANSQASKNAFIAAGGKANIEVVYNGFNVNNYQVSENNITELKQQLQLGNKYIIGHFSRLSPWKGQHILIEALVKCPENIIVILVGDALFGEDEYVNQLHQKITTLGIENRVKFLGFRNDIPQLMTMCDLVVHTSIAPEPFGRVIVEGMLCGKPVIAAKAGGAIELIEDGINGFLVTPNNPQELAETINYCFQETEIVRNMAKNAQINASQRFDINVINQQIQAIIKSPKSAAF